MNLQGLIDNLNNNLSENKKLVHLKYYLESYSGNEWINKISFDKNKKYTRNLLYCNNRYEIYVLCWNENISSNIHNHPKNGCLMKIMDGDLINEVYNKKLDIISNENLKKGDVSYIDDDIGYHKIINKNMKSISLHIYSPPKFDLTIFSKL